MEEGECDDLSPSLNQLVRNKIVIKVTPLTLDNGQILT